MSVTFVVQGPIKVVAACIESGGQLNEVSNPRVSSPREAGQCHQSAGLFWQKLPLGAPGICDCRNVINTSEASLLVQSYRMGLHAGVPVDLPHLADSRMIKTSHVQCEFQPFVRLVQTLWVQRGASVAIFKSPTFHLKKITCSELRTLYCLNGQTFQNCLWFDSKHEVQDNITRQWAENL